MNRIFTCFLFLLFLVCISNLLAQKKPQTRNKYWVFFTDKDLNSLSKTTQMLNLTKSRISPKALKRRAKVRSANNLIDKHDFLVSKNYLNKLESMGHKPVVVSNWLNSASFWLNASEIIEIAKLAFVKNIRRVGRANRKPPPEDIEPAMPIKLQKADTDSLDYGNSTIQNALINVPVVHDLGITGKGIWIGMLNTGFKYRDHEAFENLTIIAEYDFIHNDGTTENEAEQDSSGQHYHGTQTLSTIGGFKEGQLIGTAFDANFLLAKTEDITREIPAEEDNWVAGMEWLESLGADVVSSSLGYLDFYTQADMDGNTAVTTIAADFAVSRGVVVLNSAGNEGNDPWRIMIAPADGDNVIAVGAVDSQADSLYFSSVGPTADGRTKPDVVALGSRVYTALPSSNSKAASPYGFSSGTSFSCPAVAGVAALVLSAHPNLTPLEVRAALRLTADRAVNPDNKYGWGLVNAYDAVLFHGTAFSNSPVMSVDFNKNLGVSIKIVSKVGIDPDNVFLIYSKSDGDFNNTIAMPRGPEQNQYSATIPETHQSDESINFYFSSKDSSGVIALHPFNAPDSSFSSTDFLLSVNPGVSNLPSTFKLAQNYPNPFNPITRIDYDLPVKSEVTLTIFNILGQKVRMLLKQISKSAGRHHIAWDSRDESDRLVSTGVYFYAFKANQFIKVKKMLLVR